MNNFYTPFYKAVARTLILTGTVGAVVMGFGVCCAVTIEENGVETLYTPYTLFGGKGAATTELIVAEPMIVVAILFAIVAVTIGLVMKISNLFKS